MSSNEHFPSLSLFLGGARSGKSLLAETLALKSGLQPVYLATAEMGDAEMAARIDSHQERRGEHWRLIEEPIALPDALATLKSSQVVLIDCLTLWLSNVMFSGRDYHSELASLHLAIERCAGCVICVSNEVGMGIVPETKIGRQFRDAQGSVNQAIAAKAGLVVFAAAGLPLVLKGKMPDEP